MKLLLLTTIATLTTLDSLSMGQNLEVSYGEFCLIDQQEDNRDHPSQTQTTTPGVTTNKQGAVPIRSRMDAQSVYTSLVRGIEEFNFDHTHIPSRLLLSEGAVPVAVSPSGHVLIAAAQYGKGRVVVMSHEGYIINQLASFGRFLQNAIDWLKPHPDALVGVYELSNLRKFLVERGIKAKDVPSYDSTVEVFCCNAHRITQAEEVLQFVKGGGGLLIAGHAWYWKKTDGKDLLLYPGNKVISATGIMFSSETADRGVYEVPKEVPSY
ncbi:hypothetical protein SKAU_G00348370 [Synaphobranchus kaupii]|uniref:Uncharacterized protein n=1 Tax=Synaphobranchus kaupii TaxID=118154 RepID=A0A9Q1EJU3_SYNKA|nr:hypothetical protein SKAU_G00348370 [Synaphobranchus kaupii]